MSTFVRPRVAVLTVSLMMFLTEISWAQTPVGTAFTYQGQLKNNGSPANGNFNMDFKLWNDATLSAPANQVGVTISLPNVSVTNGLFSVPLDFGAVYNGEKRWLEIAVTGTTLSPRQELTATPYSRFSTAPWATSGNNISSVNTGNVGIGTASPTSKLDVAGTAKMTGLQLTTGAAAGRVLTSDASGIGTWQTTGTYAAGSGLQLAGNVFSIANNGVTSTMLASSAASLNKVSGGAMSTNGTFVGIGTSAPIGAANFVVSQATPDFGGMYVNTNATGQPFYGYAQGGTITAYHYVDGGDSNKWKLFSNGAIRLTVATGGNVGIGTTAPAALFHLNSSSANAGDNTARLSAAGLGPNNSHIHFGTTGDWYIRSASTNGKVVMQDTGGNVGIGTTSPDSKLHVTSAGGIGIHAQGTASGLGGEALRAENSSPAGIGIFSHTNSSDANVVVTNEGTGDLIRGFSGVGGSNLAFQVRNDGTTSVPMLEIRGADVAERFPVSDKVEPGMVVEIDPDNPGQLRLARGAYNRRVAGIVSGAGGLPAGAILGNLPGNEKAPPVALSGRVWVHGDAANGAIAPGDMLTTSDASGHAMRVSDYSRAQGAIIGKSMSSLREGRGLVLVLVNLQ